MHVVLLHECYKRGLTLEQIEKKIELKLTYNTNKNMPRTFFVHLFHVPLDATVDITQDDRALPIERFNDYVRSRSWIQPDIEVSIKICRGDSCLASATYLLHNDQIFAPVMENKDIDLIQITYMTT